MEELNLKVLLLGSSRVGKTAIHRRFGQKDFELSPVPTIATDFQARTIQIDDSLIKLQCWDTAGQERFRSINAAYFRGANACLIVFDLSDRSSFEDVTDWARYLKKFSRADLVLCVVGNKSDLATCRVVSADEGRQLAREHNALYFEVSAKTESGVMEMFEQVARTTMQRVLATPPVDARDSIRVRPAPQASVNNPCVC